MVKYLAFQDPTSLKFHNQTDKLPKLSRYMMRKILTQFDSRDGAQNARPRESQTAQWPLNPSLCFTQNKNRAQKFPSYNIGG